MRKNLNAVIASVGNGNVIQRVARNVPWIVELTNLTAIATELEDRMAHFGKHLDAMIVFVCDDDVILN